MRISCPEATIPELLAAMRLDGVAMAIIDQTGPGWIFEFSLRQPATSATTKLIDAGKVTQLPPPR